MLLSLDLSWISVSLACSCFNSYVVEILISSERIGVKLQLTVALRLQNDLLVSVVFWLLILLYSRHLQ